MNIFKISRNEIKDLFKSRLLRLAILVVTIVPLLYGILYLWAFWNPYGKLNNLPVAIVNEDNGASSDGKNVNFGQELVNNLKTKDILKWDYVSQEESDKGLKSGKYFAEIKIPNDFSTKILSASTANPEQASLVFIARESNSMIGAQLTNRVVSQISDNMSHEIAKNYLDNIFLQTRLSAEDIQKAADGTAQLSEGLSAASSGTTELTNGTDSAYSGATSLSLAINQILTGDKNLNAGIKKALSGSEDLNFGLKSAASGAKSLSDGTATLQSGATTIKGAVNSLISNITAVNTNLVIVKSYLSDPNTTISDATSPFNGMTKLQAASYIINNIVVESSKSENTQQIASLQTGLESLTTGISDLNQGASNLSSALNGQILTGSSSLSSGLSDLASGSDSINKGLLAVSDGSEKLSSGLLSVSSGTKSLNTGISSAKTGADTLGENLSEGAKKALQNSDINLTEKITPILSNPVIMEDASIDKVENYGTGFAPYFIPLSLWVGGLVLFLVIKFEKDETKRKKIKPKLLSASKFITLAKVGTAQAIVLDLVLIFALGLKPTNYIYLFLFTILTSLCFLSILQLLITAFQDAGKFIGIVLLMLQLTSASGTYPVQTAPLFFQKISPYLPMTYAVRGLREIISGGNIHNMVVATLYLLVFLAGFLLLLILLSDRISKSRLNVTV